MTVWSTFSLNDYHLFPALKQNLGSHSLEEHNEVETVVTQWLITEDKAWYWQEIQELALCYGKFLSCRGGVRVGGKMTMLQSNKIARQLNPNCSYQILKVNKPKYTQINLLPKWPSYNLPIAVKVVDYTKGRFTIYQFLSSTHLSLSVSDTVSSSSSSFCCCSSSFVAGSTNSFTTQKS